MFDTAEKLSKSALICQSYTHKFTATFLWAKV